MFGKEKSLYQVNTLEENEHYELMYRAPGREDHQNIVEILDEVFIRLENIEKTLENLKNG